MGFLKNIFGKIKPSTKRRCESEDFIEIPNEWGIGDGTPLLVERFPNLEKIFTDTNPPIPQQLTERNNKYWEEANLEAKRNALAIAYLQHPDFCIQKKTIPLVENICSIGVIQVLVCLFANPYPWFSDVRKQAAQSIWRRGKDNCEYAVRVLRDIIRGHTSLGFAANFPLTRTEAIQALDIFVEEAPNVDARKTIMEIVDKEIVIEERIKPGSFAAVTYVETLYLEGGKVVKNIYQAKSREEALAFLKSKTVTKKLHYIEVDTPEGTFGLDIAGMYKV